MKDELTKIDELLAQPPGTILIGAAHIGDRNEYSVYMWTGEHLRLMVDGGPRHPSNVLAVGELEAVWRP